MGHGQASHEAVDLGRSAFNGFQDVTALVEVLEHVFPEGRFAGCLFSAADSQGFLWFQYVFFLWFIFITVGFTRVTFFVRLCWQIMRQFLHYKTMMSLKGCKTIALFGAILCSLSKSSQSKIIFLYFNDYHMKFYKTWIFGQREITAFCVKPRRLTGCCRMIFKKIHLSNFVVLQRGTYV